MFSMPDGCPSCVAPAVPDQVLRTRYEYCDPN